MRPSSETWWTALRAAVAAACIGYLAWTMWAYPPAAKAPPVPLPKPEARG